MRNKTLKYNVLQCHKHNNQVLDSLRSIYEHLDDELVQTAKGILQQAPLLSHVSVEYLPQIGYLITIQEQDQHFLPSTDPLPTAWVNNETEGDDQLRSYRGHPSSTSFSSERPPRLSDMMPNQQSQEGTNFPPEYQHIYSSEGKMSISCLYVIKSRYRQIIYSS